MPSILGVAGRARLMLTMLGLSWNIVAKDGRLRMMLMMLGLVFGMRGFVDQQDAIGVLVAWGGKWKDEPG